MVHTSYGTSPCPPSQGGNVLSHFGKSLHPNSRISASISKSSAKIHETTLTIDGLSSLIDETTLMICLWMQVFGSLRPDRNPFSKEYKQLLACCSCHIIEQKQAISWISTQNIVSLRMIKDKDHEQLP